MNDQLHALSQNCEKWTILLKRHFEEAIHSFMNDLFSEARAYAKSLNRSKDENFIIGVFQLWCVSVKQWSEDELNDQIIRIRKRYSDLDNLIDTVLRATLTVMALFRTSKVSAIQMPKVTTSSFVKTAYEQCCKEVGCRYFKLFDRNVHESEKWRCYLKAQELLNKEIDFVILNFLPLKALNAKEKPMKARSTKRSQLTKQNLQLINSKYDDDDIKPEDSISQVAVPLKTTDRKQQQIKEYVTQVVEEKLDDLPKPRDVPSNIESDESSKIEQDQRNNNLSINEKTDSETPQTLNKKESSKENQENKTPIKEYVEYVPIQIESSKPEKSNLFKTDLKRSRGSEKVIIDQTPKLVQDIKN